MNLQVGLQGLGFGFYDAGTNRLRIREVGLYRTSGTLSGLLSNQGEKSINLHLFIMVPLRKKALKYGTPKIMHKGFSSLDLKYQGLSV